MTKHSLAIPTAVVLTVWLADSALGALFFFPESSFLDCLLLRGLPAYAVYARFFLGAGALACGILLYLTRRERAEARATLRDSQVRYRQIVEHATNVFYKHDADHRLTYLSPQIRDLLDYTPEEAMGLWMDLATDHPVNEEGYRITDRAIRTGERQPPFHLQLRHKEGWNVWVEVREAPVLEENGQVFIVGALTDISDQVDAGEALRSSEERFRNLIEQSHDGIYLLYKNQFELVNRRFCELTGVSRTEALDPTFSFWQLIAPESVPLIRQRQELRARGEEIPHTYDFTIQRPDGSRVLVAASVSVIEYRDGEAVLGFLRDVTEQQALEDQLRQAQKMESIGRLSGGVAHDLNNLLSPILGYGELLLEDLGPTDARRESAREILQAGNRARDLVQQLLAFSRRQTLEFEPLNLNRLLDDFRNLLRRTIRENIRIQESQEPDLPDILGDRGQLEQVIMNLSVNAQDAMPDGGTLRVETDVREIHDSQVSPHYALSAGPCVVLTLADTGEGMDLATQERIFEPFFTTKEQGRGTGLGLATVYGIVKQHGGGIWVESEPGKGTVFRCCFPAMESSPEVASAPPVTEEVPEEEKGKEGILVVEDDDGVRNLTVTVLRRKGYSVWAASNGRDCLDMVSALDPPPHLLLTDVVLPNMTGMELYRQLSRRLPDLRVLYMSGYTQEDVLSRGILPEDMGYIQKPFTPETLTRTLRQVLVD